MDFFVIDAFPIFVYSFYLMPVVFVECMCITRDKQQNTIELFLFIFLFLFSGGTAFQYRLSLRSFQYPTIFESYNCRFFVLCMRHPFVSFLTLIFSQNVQLCN